MNYINISTHKFVGRNNQQLTKKLSLDFELTNVIQFQFINSNNQILDIDSSNLYLAGAIIPDYSNSKVIFYSNNYTYDSETKTLTFTIDTFTENYAKYIKRPDQISFLEIGKNARENILCFDTIICQPRIYTPETPSPEHLDEYYTMEEADEKFATISGFNELSGIVSGDIQNLANNYWTKQQVAEQIANIERLTIVVVEELPPVEEGHDFTIYLVPDAEGSADNNYLEYLRINGHWELIGSTAIDLSQYYTKDEVNSNFLPLSGGTITGNLTATKYFGGGNFTIDAGAVHLGPYSTGSLSHLAIGQSHNLNGWYDVAIGKNVVDSSPAAGYTFSYGNDLIVNESYQLLLGQHNIKTIGARVTGGGLSSSDRKNIEVLDWNGNLTLAGGLSATGLTINNVSLDAMLSGYLPTSGITMNSDDIFRLKCYKSNMFRDLFNITNAKNPSVTIGDSNSLYTLSNLYVHAGYFRINTGGLVYNGNLSNSPGGIVIQNAGGQISAPYIEATSGLTASGAIFEDRVITKKLLEIQGDIKSNTNAYPTPYISIDGHQSTINRPLYGGLFIGRQQSISPGQTAIAIGRGHTLNASSQYKNYANAIFGQYGTITGDTIFAIGNGESSAAKSNAFAVTASGDIIVPGIVNAGSVSINGSRLTALLSTTIVPMQGVTYTHTLQENDTFTIETPMSGYSPTFELWFTQPDTAVNFSFITNISWDDGTGHISSNNTRPPMNEANVTYCIVLRWTGTRWIGNLAYTEDISE